MPGLSRLRRLAVLGTLPETRRLIARGARPANLRAAPANLRAIAARARADRAALLRDAVNHPAAAELANAGMLLLPMRYTPLGWAGAWALRRLTRNRRSLARRPAG